ncbi:MAG TPA: hypothetical protein VFN57_16665 [Thermomicrobiaceae bacterium]|nr:hypothetical protein [Thermomicrobiaceae bacterium]
MDGTIGYLLVQSGLQGWRFWLFVVAMGLKFVVDDCGLHRERCDDYERIARWVLTAAVLAGAAAGLPSGVPAGAIAVMRAFLAGGIMLNVLNEEIPAARPRSFWPFALGAAVYGCLLLVV